MNGRLWSTVAAVCGIQGCYLTNYPSVEEACPQWVYGEDRLAEEDVAFIRRVSCYRRYVNLSSMTIDRAIQEAVAGHARYIEENDTLDEASPNYDLNSLFTERSDLPFFQGGDVFARLDAAEAIDRSLGIGVWQIFAGVQGEDAVDRLVADPWVRDAFFQPAVIGSGFASIDQPGGPWGYMNVVYSLPPNWRMDWPVVYPKDGQEDVPVSFRPYNDPRDPLNVAAVIGFPITITVGSYEALNRPNPYDLFLDEAELVGPEGEVLPVVSAVPATYPWGDNTATVIIAPVAPLRPDSTYTLRAVISWNARTDKEVVTTFTTSADPPPPL